MPTWGPEYGQKCYMTPALLGVPKQGDKITSGCLHSATLEAQTRAKMRHNPCILGGS